MRTAFQQSGASNEVSSEPPEKDETILFKRYRVVGRPLEGGCGTVYPCIDLRFDRHVAIKRIRLAHAGDATTESGPASASRDEAIREARTTAKLDHPGIVTVHDYLLTDDDAWLVMEYVDGPDLDRLRRHVPGATLTGDECAFVLASLANALDYAHRNGVLHLDIKPSNVFLDREGIVKLGDFGIAATMSAAGWGRAPLGTLGYMPPEQIDGAGMDERTDVFALGVVCYQMLTGTNPFEAKSLEVTRRKIVRGARPLGKVMPEFAGPVSDSVGGALAADAGRRPPSVRAFADSLLPFLGDERIGRESLVTRMAQTPGQALRPAGPNDEDWRRVDDELDMSRARRQTVALERVVGALSAGLVGLRLGPVALRMLAPAASPLVSPALVAILAVLGLALPRASVILGCGLLVAVELMVGWRSLALLVALLVIVLVVLWTLGISRRADATGDPTLRRGVLISGVAALLLPIGLGLPTPGTGLAGAALAPLPALATTALGILLQVVSNVALAAPDGTALARDVLAALASPAVLTMLVVASTSAWLCALVMRRVGAGVVGLACQLLTFCMLAVARTTGPGMENAGLWLGRADSGCAAALGCAVCMSIVGAVGSSNRRPREGE